MHEAFDFFLVQLHPFMPFLTDFLREKDTSLAGVPETVAVGPEPTEVTLEEVIF